MIKYKVLLTVKDRYGNTKEVDAGDIDIDLDKEEVDDIVSSVKDQINTDTKSPVYVPDVTANNMLKFTLTDEATDEELIFDIDKSNDWNQIDQTTGSNYVWEPMQ
jgi:CTP:phosphocholine cytidylyltransferase-like protein